MASVDRLIADYFDISGLGNKEFDIFNLSLLFPGKSGIVQCILNLFIYHPCMNLLRDARQRCLVLMEISINFLFL